MSAGHDHSHVHAPANFNRAFAIGIVGTWSLFRQSLHLLFDGVPDSVDPQAVHDFLVALTAHLVMPQGRADDVFLKHATDRLHARFEITHVTLQVMKNAFTTPCAEPPDIADAHPAHHGHVH